MKNQGKIFKISGMSCSHCVKNVTQAILSVKGVINTEVNLKTNLAKVEGNFSEKDVIKAIEQAGYKAFVIN